MRKIKIADITLKKLSEEREISLLFREKSAIANKAELLGADVIELPSIKNYREDAIIFKTIAQNVQDAVLAVPVGFEKENIAKVWECIKYAKKPRIQIELPISNVSTLQMEYTYHVKQKKMLEKICELIKEAKTYCEDVEFSALDATRTSIEQIISVVKEAEKNGATLINICDDAGSSTPEDIANIIKKVKEVVAVPVYVQVSDRINLGVASAFSAIMSGVDGLKCAMIGKDVLLSGEISDAIVTCGAKLDAEIALKNTKIHASIDDMLSKINHKDYNKDNDVDDKKKIIFVSFKSVYYNSRFIRYIIL